MNDASPAVRKAAVCALEDLHAKNLVDRVARLLEDEDAAVRACAARFCGAYGQPACIIPRLEKLLRPKRTPKP